MIKDYTLLAFNSADLEQPSYTAQGIVRLHLAAMQARLDLLPAGEQELDSGSLARELHSFNAESLLLSLNASGVHSLRDLVALSYLAITTGHEAIIFCALGMKANSTNSTSLYALWKTHRWWHIRSEPEKSTSLFRQAREISIELLEKHVLQRDERDAEVPERVRRVVAIAKMRLVRWI
ncbi:hypothetical protein CYLTODRAFT_459388 [Cylindrobasidium torrendii FP15055 ss-10]|uniref:Uncharacterized protein n=1 Tax=Cylindrobasidium torrendii FP15055 ss-10 TaxID=1314674 RepID=A0A0D7AVD9_9AGAR|nr:hypothetical protein CYLTODRAFT_459388 [Cylindrobasidium torrendii FP15055 ss-10]